MKKKQKEELNEPEQITQGKAIKELTAKYRRPYGLLQQKGVTTNGMTPRDAWNEWNEIRRAEREQTKKLKKPKPKKGKVSIPKLSESNRQAANSNSMFNRGDTMVHSYEKYAEEINGWDISERQKKKLMNELHKRFEQNLSYDAKFVPWTVSGRANYPAKKMNKAADRVLQSSAEISTWFDGVRTSVKNSTRQYADTQKADAIREEEWFNRALRDGWYNRGGKPNPTSVANGLAGIAQHDPQRFAQLYEKYDKELHFRKNTNAAKLYEKIKQGKYSVKKPPQKVYESDSYNTYRKTIQSGERVFMKFTTKPKPQLIYALKKRGWPVLYLQGA